MTDGDGAARPKLLDLFCGAGGAGMGYDQAGFEVTGVDIADQPRYPFRFIQGDALEYLEAHGHEYAAIHASPPCQVFSAARTMWNARAHGDLLTPTRSLLRASPVPHVIENVVGAPLPTAIILCGSMFGLGVDGYHLRRHRYFEVSTGLMLVPACQHRSPVIGIYGDHARAHGRVTGPWQKGMDFLDRDKMRLASEAMGISWMVWEEMCQAIPPAYTEWIGRRLMEALA